MDLEERSQLGKQSATLRRELKKWEKEFAAANEGRKATREEIKQNPSIAQKYKDYNKVRDILNGKQPKSSSVAPSSPRPTREFRKRKADETQPIQTPSSKRHQRTPRKTEQPDFFDTYDSPSIIQNLFTPTKKQWISPTPQKNGRCYGLFDLMDDDNTTPNKDEKQSNALLPATPSRKTANGEELFASARKHSWTPTSSSGQKMLDQYTTPLKNRNSSGPDARRTPSSSISKLHFLTPSFLKRDSQRILMPVGEGKEDSDILSPPMVRGPRKPLVRGLSSILAGLRKMNEEAEDEDLEALREMEGETTAAPYTPKKPNKNLPPKTRLDAKPEVQVEDSQVNHLLGGFDDESKFDSEPDTTNRDGNEKLGKDGKPLRVYKKKGQKRTTRRTKIRPTNPSKALPHDVGKRLDSMSPSASPERELSLDELHSSHLSLPKEEEIPETQTAGIPDIDPDSGIIPFDSENLDYSIPDEDEDEDLDSGSDYTASSGGTRHRKADQSEHYARVQMRKQALKANSAVKKGEGGNGVNGVVGNVKKGVRKVTALAAQNFRRLKLRNRGVKGGGGGARKSGFGRRR